MSDPATNARRVAPVFRWMRPGGGVGDWAPVRAGTLVHVPGRWEFSYDEAYLSRGDDSLELDPYWLRTRQRSAFVHLGHQPPGVFADASLSGWSLDVARKALGDRRKGQEWGAWESLVYAPPDGFGALFVGDIESKPDLLVDIATALGKFSPQDMQRMAMESSSGAMGGERPKLSARMTCSDSVQRDVIVKFSGTNEAPENVIAEATALTLAQQAGLDVPWHQIEVFNGSPALCIERFDRVRNATGGVDIMHCVSAATALGLPVRSDPQDPRRSYVALRSKLREPDDALELYRRIILNAVVGNSDDHPWNHALRQIGRNRWALSPLYDVMPFRQRLAVPVLSMAITKSNARSATTANLLRAGKEISALGPEAAGSEIESMVELVHRNWESAYELHELRFLASGTSPTQEEWRQTFEGFEADVEAETDQPAAGPRQTVERDR